MNPPFLVAAFFCDNLLTEQDGVSSAIRIIDRVFVIRGEASTDKNIAAASSRGQVLTLYVSYKGGGYTGKGTVKLAPKTPSGKEMKVQELEVEFPKEPNSGVNIAIKTMVAFEEDGVYWFDIYFNGELTTRTPLDVQVATAEMTGSQPAAVPHTPK